MYTQVVHGVKPSLPELDALPVSDESCCNCVLSEWAPCRDSLQHTPHSAREDFPGCDAYACLTEGTHMVWVILPVPGSYHMSLYACQIYCLMLPSK